MQKIPKIKCPFFCFVFFGQAKKMKNSYLDYSGRYVSSFWRRNFIACLLSIGLVFASCEDILEVPDISGENVELLAPKDSAIVTDSIVNFSWNGVGEADSYLIQVATPDFENAAQILLDSIIVLDSTFLGTTASRQLNDGDYEWRVKALNSDFETPFSSSTFHVDTTN